jgi:hypothetical protein
MDAQYYTTVDIACLTGFSERWVVKWRHKIAGAQKIGRLWRFDKTVVDKRIAAKKDIRLGF